LLAGAAVWIAEQRAGLSVFGDDANTEVVDGFQNGETVRFMVWDDEAGVEYRGIPEFLAGPRVWQPNGFSVLHLTAISIRDLEVSLNLGWNMISLNVRPGLNFWADEDAEGPDVILMTEQLRNGDQHEVDIFKDVQGRFYSPAWEYNGIPCWDLTQGYMVKMIHAAVTVWSGEPIPFDTPIPLRAGWNMIAYYPDYQLSATAPDYYVLNSIIEDVDIAKHGRGEFLSPSWEFSNMPPWRETQGYMIKMNEPGTLAYPPAEEERAANCAAETEAG